MEFDRGRKTSGKMPPGASSLRSGAAAMPPNPLARLGICWALVPALASCSGDGSPGPGGQVVDPGSKGMHRLNTTEYNNTAADVLGTTLQPANSGWRGGEL